MRECGDGRPRSMRAVLQDATALQHERLHHHPFFKALLDGDLTLEPYRTLLCRLYGYYLPVEAELLEADDRWFGGDLMIERWRRTPLLQRDLRDLGLNDDAIDRLPQLAKRVVPRSPGTCLGVLYVIEGAAIGGRLLHRSLEGLLEGRSAGRRFFDGHGHSTGSRWQAVCKLLEDSVELPDQDVVDGASLAFTGMEDWLEGLRGSDAISAMTDRDLASA